MSNNLQATPLDDTPMDDNAAEIVRMNILALIASKPDAKINRSELLPKLMTATQKIKGQSFPNPCYSSESATSVIAGLVKAGYLEDKTKFGAGSYHLLPEGQSELERLTAKHGPVKQPEVAAKRNTPPKEARHSKPAPDKTMSVEEELQFLDSLGGHAREVFFRERGTGSINHDDDTQGRKF